jgi:hypothetical protein
LTHPSSRIFHYRFQRGIGVLVSLANSSGAAVLQKPCGLNALAARMCELLDGPA